MATQSLTPIQELQAVLKKHDHEIDEQDTIPFIARIREAGIITDGEWKLILRWLDEAMMHLKSGPPKGKSGALEMDADPRNADWIQIIRAQRIAGYRMPHWASLWLWWIGHDREEGPFWKQIGGIAKTMSFPRFKEGQK